MTGASMKAGFVCHKTLNQKKGCFFLRKTKGVVLASASEARVRMLEQAGIRFFRDPASIDETELKATAKAGGLSVESAAMALAEAKALKISRRHPGALVIGADQILEHRGRWFEKATDIAEAKQTLKTLRAGTHALVSGVATACDGVILWRDVQTARLSMRAFSDGFLEDYLESVGDDVLGSVGCYRIERLGLQLFSKIEGDHFTILGMPLLPLLEFLRGEDILVS